MLRRNESEPSTSITTTIKWPEPCRPFQFHEILSATQDFDESLVIGSGGFGKVYKGNIVNGSSSVIAAIKRLDSTSSQGPSEFWAEVEMLSNLRHAHLVSLIGYCNHEKEMILVYEYMPNGTLYEHLHILGTRLSWFRRLSLSIGAARGLDYLHTGTGIEFGITHRDVKSSNILIDKRWAAKISDFGLSKLVPKDQHVNTPNAAGSFGYLDPYYVATGNLSWESDVYAFGVVLLEVLCRKRAVDGTLDWGIVTWAQDSIKQGRLKDIIDSSIRDEIYRTCLKWFVQITKRCLDNNPKNRPSMTDVISTLKSVRDFQEKTDYMLHAARRKTMFVRKVDVTVNCETSGMEFGFISFMKRKLFMLKDKIPFFGQYDGTKHDSRLEAPKKEEKKEGKKDEKKGSGLNDNCFGSIIVFGAEELQKAIENYAGDKLLGRGGYDTMFKGILPDKRVVAIKMYCFSGEEPFDQFINEVAILEPLNNEKVVQLLGFCLVHQVAYLVYEYVSNGTLHDHIHNQTSGAVRLSWDTRTRIAHESASALAYLHTYPTMSIIHTNVKSANILLDENYTAKLSDFGASMLILDQYEVTTQVQGTVGYIDPEYFNTCQLTDKSDVYSFGVVLAELLTSKKAIDTERDEFRHLARYFVEANRGNRLSEIVDPLVLEEATDEQLSRACDLVCRCLEPSGGSRPSMKEVTMELESLRVNYNESSSFKIESEIVKLHDVSLPAYSNTFEE